MPLTTIRANHIKNKLPKITQGRTQLIDLTLKNPDGTTWTLSVNAIWKPDHDVDPVLSAIGPRAASVADDIVSVFLQSDVTLAQLRACIYAQPHTPIGAEIANRYILMSITPKGLLPGGDRFVCTWTRQR